MDRGLIHTTIFIFSETALIILTKIILDHGVNPLIYILLTGILSSILILFFLFACKGKNSFNLKFKSGFPLLLIGSITGASTIIGFNALKLTSATNYTLIGKTNLIMIPLLEYFVFKKIIKNNLAILLAFIGIILITSTETIQIKLVGDFLAILTAFLFSLDFILQKMFLSKLSPEIIALSRRLISSFLVFLMILVFNINFKINQQLPLIILASIFYVPLSLSLTKSIYLKTPTYVILMSTLTPLLVGIISFIFLKEFLTFTNIFGSIIILASVVLLNFKAEKI